MSSQVCSFAMASLWMVLDGAPLGFVGDTSCADAELLWLGVDGCTVALPLRWGGATRAWGCGCVASCMRTSRSGWRGTCRWDMAVRDVAPVRRGGEKKVATSWRLEIYIRDGCGRGKSGTLMGESHDHRSEDGLPSHPSELLRKITDLGGDDNLA